MKNNYKNKNKIKYNKYDVGGNLNSNDLLNQFSQTNLLSENNKAEDFYNIGANDITNALASTAGAIGGFATGNILGGITETIKTLGNVGGMISGSINAKNEAIAKNKQNSLFNNTQINNFNSAVKNNQNATFNKSLLNISANGGKLNNNNPFNNGVVEINNGGSHEINPYGGVPFGVDTKGIPNLVEEGEVIYNNFVFSNRIKVPNKNKTFAEEAKAIQKESSERPNDTISKRTMETKLAKLASLQESIKQENIFNQKGDASNNTFFPGGPLSKLGKGGLIASGVATAAPILGQTGMVISDLAGWTNKPNYSDAKAIENYANKAPQITPTLLGNYLEYNPLDRNYYINQLRAQSAATNNAIQNQAINSGMALAGLLNAGYNSQTALGNLARQSEEYNRNQQLQTETFNRGTNQYNADAIARADMANLQTYNNMLSAISNAARLKTQERLQSEAAKSANMGNLFNSIGDLGTAGLNYFAIRNNPFIKFDPITGKYLGNTAPSNDAPSSGASNPALSNNGAYGGEIKTRKRSRRK